MEAQQSQAGQRKLPDDYLAGDSTPVNLTFREIPESIRNVYDVVNVARVEPDHRKGISHLWRYMTTNLGDFDVTIILAKNIHNMCMGGDQLLLGERQAGMEELMGFFGGLIGERITEIGEEDSNRRDIKLKVLRGMKDGFKDSLDHINGCIQKLDDLLEKP